MKKNRLTKLVLKSETWGNHSEWNLNDGLVMEQPFYLRKLKEQEWENKEIGLLVIEYYLYFYWNS